ncbi:MAG: hypothetical protein IAI48_09330 [Candidatus Eremiobacteraeota bacterium]|nr:hypothetical protein [Candidatus Eremiobacteraeota bacterium]
MKINVGAFFRHDVNTHFVANSGLTVAAIAGAVHIGADLMTRGILHVPLAVAVTFGDLDTMSREGGLFGTILAYFGRPKTIPADPKPPDAPSNPIVAISQAFEKRAQADAAASPVGADVPRPSLLLAAALHHVAGLTGGSALTMATTIQGKVADAIVAFYDANQPALLALITSKNVTVVDWVENAAAALLAKNPMLALVLGGEVKSLAPQIITFFGSEEAAAVAALDAILHAEATKLGG